MCLLRLDSVSYQYDGRYQQVLKDCSIDFEAGKLYAIMGKTGAGKSTLLSLISGLDVCTAGTIEYKGTDVKKLNRDRYRAKNAGVVFQSYNLLINATAVENIVLSMHISGMRDRHLTQKAYTLLKSVGIDYETAGRKILKLSGGEQQRVGIARALAHDPDILIADEPTGNLDNETEANIMKILTTLARENRKCVVVVTHSSSVASYANELWGLNAGRAVFIR